MTVSGNQITLTRIDGTTVAASLAMSNLGAAGGSVERGERRDRLRGPARAGRALDADRRRRRPSVRRPLRRHADGHRDGPREERCRSGRTTSPSSGACSRSRGSTARRSRPASRSRPTAAAAPRSASSSCSTRRTGISPRRVTVAGARRPDRRRQRRPRLPAADRPRRPIRGPVTIDGGVSVNPEPFLGHPLLLPGRDQQAARRRHAQLRTARTNADGTRDDHRRRRDERQPDDRPAARLRPADERLRLHRRSS